MTLWEVKIGQGGSQRTQDRVTDVIVTEGFGMTDFSVRIVNPTISERSQFKGRKDAGIIQIKRGSDILVEGFIEDVESGADYVRYTGRSFLVLLGYSTSSKTSDSGDGETEAEYDGDTGKTIIDDLIATFCYPKDTEITKYVTFTETYGSKVTLHGKKVYQIVREMCQSYGYDLWSDATWNGDGINIDNKNIRVGEKSRGSSVSPNKTLYGGEHLKNIPIIKYRSSQTINCLRVIGGGTGKDKVSEFIEDATSITAIGYIEGAPYNNNMIRDVTTAQSVGQAIIDAKKDPIEQIQVELITYLSDLRYGDWVRIVDSYSNLDTTKRIKKIVKVYNYKSVDKMQIELGEKFDDYQNIIRDLTKGDVDPEPKMSYAGGSLRITANDPPDTYIRIDGGDWYGTDGVLYTYGDTIRVFWGGEPPYNATTVGNFFKALVQIKDGAASASDITYKTSLTSGAHTGYTKDYAKAEVISADSGYMPIGEIILKCCNISGTVCDITATDEGDSFIYRDARPIVGSSSAGFGGDVSNPMTENLAAGSYKITGLGAGTTAGDSVRYEQVLHLAGGTMNSEAGIDMNSGIISNCGGLSLYSSSEHIDLNGGAIKEINDFYAKYSTGIYVYDYLDALSVKLGTSGYSIECSDDINMADHNIHDVDIIDMIDSNSYIDMSNGIITNLANPTTTQGGATKGYADNLPGTNSTYFIIDQDNTAAGVSSSLRFNRGTTDGDAAIWWDETDDEFQFDSDVGVTTGSIKIGELRLGGSNKIARNGTTGDTEFTVASGDSFVFKTV